MLTTYRAPTLNSRWPRRVLWRERSGTMNHVGTSAIQMSREQLHDLVSDVKSAVLDQLLAPVG